MNINKHIDILYLGEGPCFRSDILKELGHNVFVFSTFTHVKNPWIRCLRKLDIYISKLSNKTYSRFSIFLINRYLARFLGTAKAFDVIFINQAPWITPLALKSIKYHSPHSKIVVFCNDDVTGKRDSRRFERLLSCIDYIDHWAVPRETNLVELLALGAISVEKVWMGFNSKIHFPTSQEALNSSELPSVEGKLLFIGTNISGEKRVSFLQSLITSKIPLLVLGQKWPLKKLRIQYKNYFFNKLINGKQYSYCLSQSLGVLGLLSHGNRDLHTTRSFECMATLSCFIAESTSEHKLLYEDGHEALLWSSKDQCKIICHQFIDKCRAGASERSDILHNLSLLPISSYSLQNSFSYILAQVIQEK